MPARSREAWDKAVRVPSLMRSKNLSLEKASKEIGIDPSTAKRYVGSSLRKGASGRWAAKRADNLLRVLMVPATDGKREVAVRGSRHASLLGKYWAAVNRFLETGDRSQLEEFHGRHIKAANGEQILLITDRNELKRLGSAGVISFHDMYGRNS
jgi:hypothetical protein